VAKLVFSHYLAKSTALLRQEHNRLLRMKLTDKKDTWPYSIKNFATSVKKAGHNAAQIVTKLNSQSEFSLLA
jgi:hypothetical protein